MNNEEVISHLKNDHGWNNESFITVIVNRGTTATEAHKKEHEALGERLLNHSHEEESRTF